DVYSTFISDSIKVQDINEDSDGTMKRNHGVPSDTNVYVEEPLSVSSRKRIRQMDSDVKRSAAAKHKASTQERKLDIINRKRGAAANDKASPQAKMFLGTLPLISNSIRKVQEDSDGMKGPNHDTPSNTNVQVEEPLNSSVRSSKRIRQMDSLSETQFDLTPHMQSQRWTDINAGIQQHLQKLYNTNKASLKAAHWVINPETGTYDVESIRQRRPQNITPADWDAQIAFWNDPRTKPEPLKMPKQGKEHGCMPTRIPVTCSPSRSDAARECPSLIHTFFVTHTVNGVFTRDEDRAIYEEMLRLQALGFNTPSGVPYTDEACQVRKGKQRGHLPGVGRVLSGRATGGCSLPPQSTVDPADVENHKKSNKSLTKQVKMMMRLFRSDNKFLQMLDQFEVIHLKFGGPRREVLEGAEMMRAGAIERRG
ncbi:hypothetical protein Tco_0848645, partial [Tanacetum coccineum]